MVQLSGLRAGGSGCLAGGQSVVRGVVSRTVTTTAIVAGLLAGGAPEGSGGAAQRLGGRQRLVSLAISERLIKVRLDHPIARCMELAAGLKLRYDLRFCEIAPTDPASTSSTLGIAQVAAAEFERAAALTRNERERTLLLTRAARCRRLQARCAHNSARYG